jgi:hypothetical protein
MRSGGWYPGVSQGNAARAIPMTDSAEATLLAYLRSLGSLPEDRRPKFSLAGLAVLAGLPQQPCREALGNLFRRGELEVRIHDSGRFELLPAERPDSPT